MLKSYLLFISIYIDINKIYIIYNTDHQGWPSSFVYHLKFKHHVNFTLCLNSSPTLNEKPDIGANLCLNYCQIFQPFLLEAIHL